jgi:hypothetical protein
MLVSISRVSLQICCAAAATSAIRSLICSTASPICSNAARTARRS